MSRLSVNYLNSGLFITQNYYTASEDFEVIWYLYDIFMALFELDTVSPALTHFHYIEKGCLDIYFFF